MNKKALLAALIASRENPDALEAIARVELYLAESPDTRSQTELNDLIDKWGQTLVGMDVGEIVALKRQLKSFSSDPYSDVANLH
ncbi:hypothetical protein [Methylocapsa sp. S129]|uniref:hypothetical protein n=1 Tax=Methylocapsa sp. S129 TaxID=1641869 RepID=UPI00131BE38D|nr:hypothetical protein [Methylocapsa sp. S129]